MPDFLPRRATRRTVLLGGAAAASALVARGVAPGRAGAQATPVAGGDPLPSWREGTVKRQLVDFVTRSVDPASEDYLPPDLRIATFDADGTLWCEWPASAATFWALDRARLLAESDPEFGRVPLLKEVLAGKFDDLSKVNPSDVYAIGDLANGELTQQLLVADGARWLETAVNPATKRRWVDTVYQPQRELLAWLTATGWTLFVVSGSPIDLLRAFAPRVLGVPAWRVVGTTYDYGFATIDGKGQVVTSSDIAAVDVGVDKATAIALHVGVRPALAFGNSDGDLQMLQYVLGSPIPGLALLLHHTDAAREFAYDRDFVWSPFAKALDLAPKEGFVLVDMARDWATVWPSQPAPSLFGD